MPVSFHLAADLESALQSAAQAAGLEPGFAPELRPADPRHGDFQANGALGYAKARRLNPREVAGQLVAALPPAVREDFDVAIAGPGFINLTLRPAGLLEWLQQHNDVTHLKAGAAALYRGRRYVVDYGSPNTAKQMHVGHIRSIIIGEAICRLLAFCGAEVIRDNHLGDWGTQFGMILYGYRHFLDEAALARDPLEEFERLYKVANAACKADPAALEQARQELVRLQQGEPAAVALWQQVNRLSLDSLTAIYRRLDVHYDHFLGESFYRDQVDAIYRELTAAGLAVESQGALVVFHPGHPRFATQPFIIRKSDGASNYASTDLATMAYRVEHFRADGVIVVTDTRQNDHFEQLWLTTQKWFAATGRRLPEFQHVTFGTILGEDGKAIKTRSGDPIKLQDLLDEAEERAFALVTEKSPDLPEPERRDIARAVGIGAVRYADLAQNRSSDYVFAWEKILSFDGNTAPYLLYAVSRIRSIFRKAGLEPADAAATAGATPPETPGELALARKLVGFATVLNLTTAQLRPHFLCTYLFELAGEFSAFYAADKVIVDEPAVRARRLLLCARTLLVLENGLHLLGLRPLARM
jgi:arginyl-tRNA synthetase